MSAGRSRRTKMASPFGLTDEELVYIAKYLDTQDRITFAYTCSRLWEIYHNYPTMMSKVDLSGCLIRKEEASIKEFFFDKQMMQNIRELHLNNQRALNWQYADVKKFISLCPQLEALHILNCKMSLRNLHCILQHATKLTALSVSIMHLSVEDTEFIKQDSKSANGMCLENIRTLRIEIDSSKTHVWILSYLVLSHCKSLEELAICIWDLPYLEICRIETDSTFLQQQSTAMTEPLQHFHSLTVETRNFSRPPRYNSIEPELSNFIISLITKKPRGTKWKTFWLPQNIYLDNLLVKTVLDAFDSVEAFSTSDALTEDKTTGKSLFETINDCAVRKLHLHHMTLLDDFESLARIGGDSLQCLFVSDECEHCVTDEDSPDIFDTLFSACSNIRELDLIQIHFEVNICPALSRLKHLVKLSLQECAIARDCPTEGNAKFLSLAEACPDVADFFVCDCRMKDCENSRLNVFDDLLPIAKWAKLESLTCIKTTWNTQECNEISELHGIFLKNLIENCKYLTMLRIAIKGFDDESYFSFLRSAKFLKHLAIFVQNVDFASAAIWKLLSCAINLERLCIVSSYKGALNVAAAMDMLKSLSQLHVLHLHFPHVENAQTFCEHIVKAVEEEKSDRSSCFEFALEEKCKWTLKNLLPLNFIELCRVMPRMGLQSKNIKKSRIFWKI